MRVGLIALQHESNTFIPTPTTLDDFRRGVLATGQDLLRQYESAHHEVGGFIEGLRTAKIEAVPIFAAWATPSGTVVSEAYRELLQMILRGLDEAGRVDGLLVAPHGAGVCESEPDMDGHWLATLRQRIGAEKPMIGTLDLHANISRRMIDSCDGMIAYRTNPHLDQRARGLEAAALMARTLRGEVRPTQAVSFPNVAINIATQETDAPPCSMLVAQADAERAKPGVLSISTVLGFPYADVPEMGSSFIAVTDGDRALAQRAADALADWLVAHRHDYVGQLPGIEDAVNQALRLDGPVCLLDVGDNVGGGSPADGTLIAHALHARRTRSFVCLYDPLAATRAVAAGPGAMLELEMGGKTDDLHGKPLRAKVTVVSLHNGSFTETQPRHGGKTSYDMGRTAIVETDGGITLQLTSRRTPPFSLNQLLSCGVEPQRFHVLVAKGVNAPIAAYRPVCRHILRVNTSGVTTADMTLLPFRHRRRPMFPFEEI
ncbi:MAG TPA: M81 family metallopeptidase [Tepidisphaeraceae bacterium]|nr:M81 family metallopeptidase [Tepidisphaeraceae bacterium]